ncbi:MAG: HAD family hydrolase [Verrucomicrobiales bacterium]|nr:HAD family hydrolase [Verrucomicrobiales bacterium]MCP5558160.1 HAD family hydrolase [Verrucomicrobiaceae bacterium]
MIIEAVIFDLDGTLIDSLADLANAVNRTLTAHGFPIRKIELFPEFIGDGMRVLIERALPADARTAEMIDRCTLAYAKEYAECWHDQTAAYSGIPELLQALSARDVKLGVISNKPDAFTRLCCDHFFPDIQFSVVFGQRETVARKPAPDAGIEACQLLGILPHQCIYVGDSGVDMQFGKSSGMIPVGVNWGFRSVEELVENGARRIIAAPNDLLALLEPSSTI